MRPMRTAMAFALAMTIWLLATFALHGQELTGKPWIDMDYGPFLTATIEVTDGNIAHKGIAVRLDQGPGGVSFGRAFMVFDTDTLRMAGGWIGKGFIDWRNVLFDGSHGTHPSIVGSLVFSNGPGPGWSNPKTGSFDDPRIVGRDGKHYGPLPRHHAHWRGLYRHGPHVLLDYTVGSARVHELPGLHEAGGMQWLTRTFNIAPHSTTLVMRVLERQPGIEYTAVSRRRDDGWYVHLLLPQDRARTTAPRRSGFWSLNGDAFLEVPADQTRQAGLLEHDLTIVARVRIRKGGTIAALTAPDDTWRRDGRTFFIRNGHLVFDVCDVGQCVSRERLTPGEWHTVAAVWSRKTGQVAMYIDGEPTELRGRTRLAPHGPVQGFVLRVGRTSRQFPRGVPVNFDGDIDWVAIVRGSLDQAQLARVAESAPTETADIVWDFQGSEANRKQVPSSGQAHLSARVQFDASAKRLTPIIAVVTATATAPLKLEKNRITCSFAPATENRRVLLAYGVPGRTDLATDAILSSLPAPRDLAPLTRPGPPLWANTMEVVPPPPRKAGSFEVLDLTPAGANPWRSWLRLGGLDFMSSNPDRLIVCNWQGDVWQIDGLTSLDSSAPRLRWRRIASGLFQPLGLKVVDDTIYVLGRDQITILRDRNGDGEADYYENFNNDHQVTEHFHEFAMDLQLGPDGNFYYTKGGRHALDAVVPQHGTLLKVRRDGSSTEIVAWGFRAPNGLGISPKGEFVVSDQQGHWTPANRINYVRPGKFYGYMWSYHPGPPPQTYEPPLCWLPQDTDRSPAEQIWVTPKSWGILHGKLLSLSYGTGRVFLVPHEVVGEVAQGGVVPLPLEFPTGIMRGRFHPKTDDLYVCGLFGWSSNKTQPGGLFRIRYRGGPLYLPVDVACFSQGILLTFSDPLDRRAAENVQNYYLEQWNYRWAQRYGSDQWKVSNPTEQGHDPVPILDAVLLDDRRTVFLRVEQLQPVMQMRLNFNLKASDGTEVRNRFDFTVNAVRSLPAQLASRVLRARRIETTAVQPRALERGACVRFRSLKEAAREDLRIDRLFALHVAEGNSPTPFLPLGRFEAKFEGYVQVTEPGIYRFQATGTGHCTVTVAGTRAWSGELQQDLDRARPGPMITLPSGYVHLRVAYRSPSQGHSRFRLYWQSDRFGAEPIPPSLIWHKPDDQTAASAMLRRGRELYGVLRCGNCHGPAPSPASPPELSMDAPSLAGAADRLKAEWLADWILDPPAQRPGAHMPRLLPPGSDASRQAARDIAAFLSTLHDKGSSRAALRADVGAGDSLWSSRGCVACHRLDDGPDAYRRLSLRHVPAKFTPQGLAAYLADPVRHYRWNPMPDFKLNPAEARDLAAFLVSRASSSAAHRIDGDPDRGRALVRKLRCAACHDFGPDQESLASDHRVFPLGNPLDGCQMQSEPDGTGKPAYALSQEDRAALTHWLRAGRPGLERVAWPEFARRSMARLQCIACHTVDGSGGRLRTILIEEGYVDEIPPRLPDLTWVGEKLQPEWTRQFLDGSLPYRPRPWLDIRMPCFPAYAAGIAAGLAQQHGYPPDYCEEVDVSDELAEVGSRLIRLAGGFNCVQCHGLGKEPPTAPFENRGVNLSIVRDRLTSEYFFRWLRNPVRIDPATKMPMLVGSDGTSPVKHVYGGNAEPQFRAIWHFLHSERVPPPGSPRTLRRR